MPTLTLTSPSSVREPPRAESSPQERLTCRPVRTDMALLGSRSLADVIMLEGLTWSRAGLKSNPRSPRQKRTQRHTGRQRRRGYRPGASPAKVQDAEEEEGRLEMLLPQTPRGGLVSRPLTVDLGEAHFCCDSHQLGSSDRTVATPRSTRTLLGSESRTPRSAHSPPGDAARFRDPGELAVCSPTSIPRVVPGCSFRLRPPALGGGATAVARAESSREGSAVRCTEGDLRPHR